MKCTVTDLRAKEVVNVDNGCRLGCVTDVEIDTCTGCLVSITVFCGRGICGSIFGKGDEMIVPWRDIVVIGDDMILVRKGGVKLS
jgi:YlmC/YmxH family sporulation protein